MVMMYFLLRLKVKKKLENTAVVLRIMDGGQKSHFATPTTLDDSMSITPLEFSLVSWVGYSSLFHMTFFYHELLYFFSVKFTPFRVQFYEFW